MSRGSSRQSAGYYLRRAIDSIVRSPVITGVTLVSIAVGVLFAGAIVLVSSNAQRVVAMWATAGIDVSLYLEAEAAEDDIVALKSGLGEDQYVREVRYISREEAWHFLAAHLGDGARLLDGLDATILPASVEVALEPSLGEDELARRLTEWGEAKGVSDVQYNRYDLARRGSAVGIVGWVAWFLGALALVTSSILVAATFQLAAYSRREELEVLRLMGAVGRLYWGPIVLAGLLEGATAAGAALGLLVAAYVGLSVSLASALPSVAGGVTFLTAPQIGALVVWGAFLGVLGSLFGMWRVSQWR